MRRAASPGALPAIGWRTLLADESSGVRPPSGARAAARSFHRDEGGTLTILFLFLWLGFYVAAALVWNQGLAVSHRIRNQTAADAAAYAAATWNARCLNNVTGANLLLVRHAAAQAVATAHAFAVFKPPSNWQKALSKLFSNPLTVPAGVALAAYIASVEVPPWSSLWLAQGFVPMAGDGFPLLGFWGPYKQRVDQIHSYEKAWIDATPLLIEATRKQIEKYYGVEVRYTWPAATPQDAKKGSVRPPLKKGDFLTLFLPVYLRLQQTDAKGFPQFGKFHVIKVGKATKEWNAAIAAAGPLAALAFGPKHYVLVTQQGPIEQGMPPGETPQARKKRRPFSVVATVTGKGPKKSIFGTALAASGIYDQPFAPKNRLVTYAQAEVFHPIDGVFQGQLPLPFRLWTTWGWQWQPRLALGDQLRRALEIDPKAKKRWQEIGVQPKNYSQLLEAAHH